MKKLFMFALITSASVSSHAIHAYRSMECENETHTLSYNGNYPVGGSYTLKNKATGKSIEVLEADGEKDDSYQLDFLDYSKISEAETPANCSGKSGEYEYSKSESEIFSNLTFLRLSSQQEKTVGVKSGAEIVMKCYQSFEMPEKCK